jgi:hypothetical protein
MSVPAYHNFGLKAAHEEYASTLLPSGESFIVLHDYPPPRVEMLWRQFLGRIDCPAHYDAPEFFLEPYWAQKGPFAVLAIDSGRVIGVLTGLHLKGSVESGVASRPQIRTDDAADAFLAADLLAQGLLQEAGREKLITVFSWSWLPLPAFERRGFLRCDLEGDVVLDLCMGADALFKQFNESRRRNIRLAIKNEIDVSEATTPEDTQAYWRVYSTWRQTERKSIRHNQSFATIEKVHSMRENHRRFLARYKGQVIAATGLRFLSRGLVEYSNNCSLDEFMYLRPNDLLFWRTIQWACEHGFSKYCLGGASPFHRRSGGTVVPIYRYRLDRTFLHREDLKDKLLANARILRSEMGQRVRGLLGKMRHPKAS